MAQRPSGRLELRMTHRRLVRLADRMYRSDDGDSLVLGDPIGFQILVVQGVRRWHAPADAVARGTVK